MFDCHTHLQKYKDEELAAAIERAILAGVTRISCCATQPSDWERVRKIAEKYSFVYSSYGIHPWYATEATDARLEELEQMLLENPAAGVGEIGLDSLKPDMEIQKNVFIAQLELALRLGRRITIHCVRAHGEMLEILGRYFDVVAMPLLMAPDGIPRCLLHALSCSINEWRRYEKLGACMSVGCAVNNSNNKKVRLLAAFVPEDRLFYETDSPDGVLADSDFVRHSSPADLEYVKACVRVLRNTEEHL